MLGKLSWPAHDQMRGVDGSESGELSARILAMVLKVPNNRRKKPYVAVRARHDTTTAKHLGNLNRHQFFLFFSVIDFWKLDKMEDIGGS